LLHQREIDHDAVVADSQTTPVVSAAAHGQQHVSLSGEADDRGNVLRGGTARDQGRAPVDHRVVDLPRLVIAGVLRPDQLAREPRQLLLCGCGDGARTHTWTPVQLIIESLSYTSQARARISATTGGYHREHMAAHRHPPAVAARS